MNCSGTPQRHSPPSRILCPRSPLLKGCKRIGGPYTVAALSDQPNMKSEKCPSSTAVLLQGASVKILVSADDLCGESFHSIGQTGDQLSKRG